MVEIIYTTDLCVPEKNRSERRGSVCKGSTKKNKKLSKKWCCDKNEISDGELKREQRRREEATRKDERNEQRFQETRKMKSGAKTKRKFGDRMEAEYEFKEANEKEHQHHDDDDDRGGDERDEQKHKKQCRTGKEPVSPHSETEETREKNKINVSGNRIKDLDDGAQEKKHRPLEKDDEASTWTTKKVCIYLNL